MRCKVSVCLLLVILMLLSSVSALADYNMPYYITVDLTNQVVTVYRTEDNAVVRQMLCASGVNDYTPTGVFYLPNKRRDEERTKDFYIAKFQCTVHYATRITGSILFHSSDEPLGAPASHGCVRLKIENAQWIAENCAPGTLCKIFYSDSRDEDLVAAVSNTTYSIDSGESYEEFMKISTDSNTMGRYSSGSDVFKLQTRLQKLGFYNGEVDGVYLTSTIQAVMDAQKMLSMTVTGMADAAFIAAIYADDAPTMMNSDISEGMDGPLISTLQENLTILKLYDGEITGICDSNTVESIKRFQRAYVYTVDGTATAEMQKAALYEAEMIQALFRDSADYTLTEATDSILLAKVQAETADSVNVRSRPDTDSTSYGSLPVGFEVLVLDVKDNWALIGNDGATGYMRKKNLNAYQQEIAMLTYTDGNGTSYTIGKTADEYLSGAEYPSETFASYLAGETTQTSYDSLVSYATVTTGDDSVELNMRSLPDASGEVIASLENGSVVHVIEEAGEWMLVAIDNNRGYVRSEYLELFSNTKDYLGDEMPENTTPEEFLTLQEYGFLTTVYAIVTVEDGAPVYETANGTGDQIGLLPVDSEMTVVSTANGWSLIDYEGHRGYISNGALTFMGE